MKSRLFSRWVAAALCMSMSQTACSVTWASPPTPALKHLKADAPKRILFVGNSYLYYNDSLHNHIRRIAEEVGPHHPGDYKYKSATIGGARLAQHPLEALIKPGRLGINKPFELVVLQGGSMETLSAKNRSSFNRSVVKINETVRDTGAGVALYMTHAYAKPHPQYKYDLISTIYPAYVEAGNGINALVIPVGLAFEKAYQQRPDIKLHNAQDGSHPSLLGTYLAACVTFQSIYNRTTIGVTYDYFGRVKRSDAVFLQKIANETVLHFFDRD